jgi:cyclophilin family peptidyl-prolyl cis-trans isomerase
MPKQWSAPPEMQIDSTKRYYATLKTNKGDIRVELFADESPRTVNNFVFLAREGFYDGVPFHRVIRTFMIQTGDPTGTGMGGPGYRFADELPARHSYEPGIVAMANAGPDTNGSQFFICSGPDARFLDNRPFYTQFGRVVEGMDVVNAIASVPVGPSTRGEMSRPQEEVRIEQVLIEEM